MAERTIAYKMLSPFTKLAPIKTARLYGALKSKIILTKGKLTMGKYTRTKDTLKEYKREKLRVLEDFCIDVTFDIRYDVNHMTREIDIDHYCHDLIKKQLGAI